MPTNYVGLAIFIAFLTPGFVHAAARRALAPRGERSVLMETTAVVTVSLATNLVAVAAFGLVRWLLPDHTPDIGAMLTAPSTYWLDHLPYVTGWALLALICSCALALVAARSRTVRRLATRWAAPVILESSAWCEALSAPDDDSYPLAGLELTDGTYVSGRVVWFSTDLEETGDRDMVLAPPLRIRGLEDGDGELDAHRVIVAARDIHRIDITYISEPQAEPVKDWRWIRGRTKGGKATRSK